MSSTINQLNQWASSCLDLALISSVQTLAVAFVVGALVFVLRNRISSQFKYGLLLLVLLKFATPPFLSSPTGFFSHSSISRLPLPGNPSEIVTVNLEPYADDRHPSSAEQASPQFDAIDTGTRLETKPNLTVAPTPNTESSFSTPSWKLGLLVCYLAGLGFSLTRLVLGYRQAQQIVKTSEDLQTGPLYDQLQARSVQVGLRSVPRLLISAESSSPFAIGVFSPTIVFPKQMAADMDSEAKGIILSHELVHIRRGDLWVGWIETLMGCLWWFHPAMWWLKRELRQTREDCCDDILVANDLAAPDRYCETLIGTPQHRNQEVFEPIMAGFFGREHAVARRIRRLMDDTLFRSSRLRKSAFVGIVILAAITLPGMHHQKTSPVVTTKLTGLMGGWRNLPFTISEEEENAINQCVKISHSFNHTTNNGREFYQPRVKERLEKIIDQHPRLFYAHHLLSTWYRNNNAPELAKTHMDLALQYAPMILTQHYHTGDGAPAKGVSINQIGIECNRVQGGSLDPSLNLSFVGLTTNDEGDIFLPVYDTVYRCNGYSAPRGFASERESLGWFYSKTSVGKLPPVLIWKAGTQPSDFTRPISATPNISGAIGTDSTRLEVGSNVYHIESISRAQRDNSFVTEDGRGRSITKRGLELPSIENGAFMDHAIIDFSSPSEKQFAINHLEIRESQTNLPLKQFQDATGFMQSDHQRIHLFSLFDTLPDRINLVLVVQNYDSDAFLHKLAPQVGARVEQNGAQIEIINLNAGHHRTWHSGNGYQGELEGIDGTSEVVFHITGNENQRLSPWVVLKDGRRRILWNGWYASSWPHRHRELYVPLDEIDHFEIRPYLEPTKIYFEGLELPKRQDTQLSPVPPIVIRTNRPGQSIQSSLLAPLRIRMSCAGGDAPHGVSSDGYGSYLYGYQDEPSADKFHATWILPGLSHVSCSASYFDGTQTSSSDTMSIYGGAEMVVSAGFDASIDHSQSVQLQLRSQDRQ